MGSTYAVFVSHLKTRASEPATSFNVYKNGKEELCTPEMLPALGFSKQSRRRLATLPDFQEPLALLTIQPSDTTHAVDNGEPEGMSLGTLVAVPVATVLIGFMLVSSVRALLKRFRKQEKRRERTSFDDNG